MKSKEDIQKELIDMITTNPNEKYTTIFEIYCKENNIDENDPIICEAYDCILADWLFSSFMKIIH